MKRKLDNVAEPSPKKQKIDDSYCNERNDANISKSPSQSIEV